MSRKNKHVRQSSRQQLLEIAERDLAKGYVKDVLGRAKNLFRQNPLDEERSLLERCYLARIQELLDSGYVEGALVQFCDLMQLPPQLPQVVSALPRMRVLLGIATEKERAEALQVDGGLLGELADRLVMRPASDPKGHAQLKAEAAKISAALVAVERGDDAAAEELTKAIPRTSPFAEWKLFVRGLSAYYLRDWERAKANWTRLDPVRAANRIAQTLLAFSERTPAESVPSDVANRVRSLKNGLETGALGRDLERLAILWKANDGRGFFRLLRDLRQRNGAERMAIVQDVGTIAWKRFVIEGDKAQLANLTGLIPGPAIDPRWHRVLALSDETDRDAACEEVEGKWLKYVQDVDNIPAIPAAHRPLVIALIEHRLATLFANNARYESPEDDESPNEDFTDYYQKAIYYFRASVERWPQFRTSHIDWAKFCGQFATVDETREVYQSLLKHFPDDWDAHVWLATQFTEADSPELAASHIAAVTRLKPRDKTVAMLRWNQQLSKIHIAIRQREFDVAHAEITRLDAVCREAGQMEFHQPFTFDLLRASVEYKSQNLEAAERHVAAAVAKVADPAIIWLTLACSCSRHKYDKTTKKLIDDNLQNVLKGKPNSIAAGQLSQFLLTNASESRNYAGRAGHYQLLKKYLARCKSLSWEVGHLRQVCRFLYHCTRGPAHLVKTLAGNGERRFPKDPLFPALLGLTEFDRGPRKCHLYSAEAKLKWAFELNHNAEAKLEDNELMHVRGALATVTSELDHRHSFGFGVEFGGGYRFEDDDDDDDDGSHSASNAASRSTFFFGGMGPRGSANSSKAREDAAARKLQLPPEVTIDLALKMMPKKLREPVDKFAKEMGVSIKEAFLRMIEMEMGRDPPDQGAKRKQ